MIDPTELEAAIDKLKNVPSGEIFKTIGHVLSSHHQSQKVIGDVLSAYGRRLNALEQAEKHDANGRFRRNAIPVFSGDGKRIDTHFEWRPVGPGKFLKLCSACARTARFIANCLRKK